MIYIQVQTQQIQIKKVDNQNICKNTANADKKMDNLVIKIINIDRAINFSKNIDKKVDR